ncbi:hypothetical protein FNV43_RR11783 [Rhamnella rubrinervis]|uniref:Receptor-like serine/threonine-protein kinase n=1 Tax=Rhamnella rubrinervis TaxID=2594499 RepID=A0A8K0MI67_9ROSA|nr:hypothetical protein FNV43_RR11783 [Rhamnella rubrinervis]
MDIYIIFLVLLFIRRADYSSSSTIDTLSQGSSISVSQKPEDVLVSSNGVFTAGFSSVGDNAFCFTINFTKSFPPTIVWVANRDQPVNGIGSKLTLLTSGNLILLDAGKITLWSTETTSTSSVHLRLHDNGNLVLYNTRSQSLWESFNSPTDTLLAEQKVTKDASLLSSKSRTNYSSGYYKLFYDNDNVLRLLFQGSDSQISSLYWPDPWKRPFETGRSTYNNSKLGMFNSTGHFWSSDDMVFSASDCDAVLYRRLTIEPDGNLRMYSFDEKNRMWVVSWQAVSEPCKIHGICGANSLCIYDHALGRKCSCLKGFKMKSCPDWSYGCEPEFNNSFSNTQELGFIHIASAEFYGYDFDYYENLTLQRCKEECLKFYKCKAFQYKFSDDCQCYNCYLKSILLNGRQTPNFDGDVYVKLPKAIISSLEIKPIEQLRLDCPHHLEPVMLNRTYERARESGSIKFLLWLAVSVAGVEIACISSVLFFLYWKNRSEGTDKATQGYMLAATRFQKFSYSEMKRATRGFREEIGRGAGGVVYKGVLADHRVAAIKRLNYEADGGEGEFLKEVSTIGRLNHMNLIEIWGYCAEGKHRLLVYEYMVNGSLASKMVSPNNELDWEKRFGIALGTAKGLSYLHEECLEWVLHCDVKPQNILLDSSYHPKVADFGLSKLQYRSAVPQNSSFSRIRGTRGYMAPEWVYNLPITSKVDVYSYGIVALELVTGRKPTGIQIISESTGGMALSEQHGRLVTWVKEKMKMVNGVRGTDESWIQQVADPLMGGKFDKQKLEVVVKVALQCVEENKEARPSMSQVVEMLQCHDDEQSVIH